MKESLNKLGDIITDYHETIDPNGDQLNEWVKNVSALLFFLATERANIHKECTAYQHQLTEDGTPVNRSEIKTSLEYPEMYMLRTVMKAGYEVLGAMRSILVSKREERKYS